MVEIYKIALPKDKLSGGQTQMSLRILIGALNEAWELVRKRFLRSHFGKAYQPLLDERGAAALARLKKQTGKGSLLADLRNAWIFHHPDEGEIAEEACAACCDPRYFLQMKLESGLKKGPDHEAIEVHGRADHCGAA
jgi:hypothetical protein